MDGAEGGMGQGLAAGWSPNRRGGGSRRLGLPTGTARQRGCALPHACQVSLGSTQQLHAGQRLTLCLPVSLDQVFEGDGGHLSHRWVAPLLQRHPQQVDHLPPSMLALHARRPGKAAVSSTWHGGASRPREWQAAGGGGGGGDGMQGRDIAARHSWAELYQPAQTPGSVPPPPPCAKRGQGWCRPRGPR